MTEASPATLRAICTQLQTLDAPSPEVVAAQLAAFAERFPPARLARLSGAELLEEMHGRTTRDSMVYWLEFKADETFQSRLFGSISGGSALKFVVYQSSETGIWHTHGDSSASVGKEISVAEAAAIAERQRDQLLAAVAVLSGISDRPDDSGYDQLQTNIVAAASDYSHLAFFHKTLSLHFPERLDDYHSINYQNHILTSMGIKPPGNGLYSAAGLFVRLLRAVREQLGTPVPMTTLGEALNRMYGPPVNHWRVGTGQNGEFWDHMRERGVVAVGWEALGDLSDILAGVRGHEAIEALKRAIKKQWPETDNRVVGREARQLWKFYSAMQEGDRVYAAYGQTIRGVGVIEGPYTYAEDDFRYRFRRKIRWLSTTPFVAASSTGLQTTVAALTNALDIRAQAARHLQSSAAAQPVATPRKPISRDGPIGSLLTQLERKGQVVLYGPPGTGKTYYALQAAEALVADASHRSTWAELSAEQREALKGHRRIEDQRIWTCTFHPAYGYEDFVEGLRAHPVPGGLEFHPEPGLFLQICNLVGHRRNEKFVLIIDEFNRGDAPRIFGELLTLLELEKRGSVHVQLPLSGQRFTVPPNVYVIATMNTADRSISLLDAAMRRRFGFVEYMPAAAPLNGGVVGGLSLSELLGVINKRLVDTLGDAARNLQVGHAYFMNKAQPITSVFALRDAIRYDLFPLCRSTAPRILAPGQAPR